jgi:hypothetical protein
LEQKINEDIPLLTSWLQTNRLSLNLKKTHIMLFGKKREGLENSITTNIGGTIIELVTQTKFLGIILDNGLTWKQHIAYLSTKLSKSIGILARARKFLDKNTLKQLYHSFIYPYIMYCNVVWGNAPANVTWPIFRAQKRAIRIISNLRGRDSTKLAFHRLGILRLPEVYKFSTLLFVYKFKNGLLPPTFNSFYTTNNEVHNYHTRHARHLRPPIAKSRIATSFIKKSGVDIWNGFPVTLTHDIKIGLFKKLIMSQLIAQYTV